MRIGEIFRYARPYKPDPEDIDGLPNYFHRTYTQGANLPLLESGINPIQKIGKLPDQRCPAILLSSSPHKLGSIETPWQDFFDPDNGHIRYFGDNKEPGISPANPAGNRALLEQFELHSSPDRSKRMKACPILFFRRVKVHGRSKGNVEFNGFGILNRAELVTQYDRKYQRSFTNYVFDFTVLSLAKDNEIFSWDWISARRSLKYSDEECMRKAPFSWQVWVRDGTRAIESCRRRVVKLLTYSTDEQRPAKGSQEERALRDIYNFYCGRNARFESLASIIAARIVQKNGYTYRKGWITPPSSDHGTDFVGRLDIGTDLAGAKIVVLGQAKCERLDAPTGGNHIARTVARLRRGWIGVYVTTSYFSESVQREVLEDKYPIILVNGLRLAQETLKLTYDQGFPTVTDLLRFIESNHNSMVMQRDPEEILFE
jgi:hypothetical protein